MKVRTLRKRAQRMMGLAMEKPPLQEEDFN
jgi:hypothetical protein